MVWHLWTLLCCYGIIPLVFADDAFTLRKNIAEMVEHAGILNSENEQLSQQLLATKQECDAQLQPLEQKRLELEELNLEEYKKVVELTDNILAKRNENEMLISAISREITIHNKYSLQIELYNHEIELYGGRKQEGVADKCHLLKPLFKNYESSLSYRSVGRARELLSTKDEIIVLQNDFNQNKLIVQALLNKNKELKNQIENIIKLCAFKKADLQALVEAGEEQLKEAIQNTDLLQQDLNEIEAEVQNKQATLQEMKETNRKLKEESYQLKSQLEVYEQDLNCYKLVTNLEVDYK